MRCGASLQQLLSRDNGCSGRQRRGGTGFNIAVIMLSCRRDNTAFPYFGRKQPCLHKQAAIKTIGASRCHIWQEIVTDGFEQTVKWCWRVPSKCEDNKSELDGLHRIHAPIAKSWVAKYYRNITSDDKIKDVWAFENKGQLVVNICTEAKTASSHL